MLFVGLLMTSTFVWLRFLFQFYFFFCTYQSDVNVLLFHIFCFSFFPNSSFGMRAINEPQVPSLIHSFVGCTYIFVLLLTTLFMKLLLWCSFGRCLLSWKTKECAHSSRPDLLLHRFYYELLYIYVWFLVWPNTLDYWVNAATIKPFI